MQMPISLHLEDKGLSLLKKDRSSARSQARGGYASSHRAKLVMTSQRVPFASNLPVVFLVFDQNQQRDREL